MRFSHRLILRTAVLAGLVPATAALCTGCGGGATQTVNTALTAKNDAVNAVNNAEQTAVNTAIQVVQNTIFHVDTIPQMVYDLANGVLSANNQSGWGQPKMVVVTDTDFVLVYDTPTLEMRQNHIPRMVIIKRADLVDPSRGS